MSGYAHFITSYKIECVSGGGHTIKHPTCHLRLVRVCVAKSSHIEQAWSVQTFDESGRMVSSGVEWIRLPVLSMDDDLASEAVTDKAQTT